MTNQLPKPDAASAAGPVVEQVVSAAGLELVQVELKGQGRGRLLRVLIDQPAGITLNDCERVSRALSDVLDAEPELIAGSYMLEVSSPGLDRPLVKRADFERFRGQRARVRTALPLAGSRNFTGLLEDSDDTGLRLRTGAATEPVVTIAWENVAQARLAPSFEAPAPAKPRRGGRHAHG